MHVRLIIMGLLGLLTGFASAQAPAPAPTITHDAVSTAESGKPITLVARVAGNKSAVKAVYLYYTISKDSAPTRVVMKSTGVGAYYGLVPAKFTQAGKLYYYMEAGNTAGEWAESPWYVINLREGASTPAPTRSPVPQARERPKWFWPAIIGGTVLVVAGAAALAGGGGSSGGGDPAPPAGGGGQTSPTTFTQGANDFVSTAGVSFPRDTPIDASPSLVGRTVSQVLVNVNFNPVDGLAERFQIIYGGNTVFDSGSITDNTSVSEVFQGNSSVVIIRVTSSTGDERDRFFYNWNGTATFTFE